MSAFMILLHSYINICLTSRLLDTQVASVRQNLISCYHLVTIDRVKILLCYFQGESKAH